MLRNTANNWGIVARSLHWLLAVSIVVQLILGRIAEDLPISPQKLEWFTWHKSLGVSILVLVVLRIVWRSINLTPDPPAGVSALEQRLGRVAHLILYGLMVAMPVSGWWISDTSRIPFRLFGLVPAPDLIAADRASSEIAAGIHEVLATLLMIVVVTHVLAALRHHFVLRNDTLRRMWLPRRLPED